MLPILGTGTVPVVNTGPVSVATQSLTVAVLPVFFALLHCCINVLSGLESVAVLLVARVVGVCKGRLLEAVAPALVLCSLLELSWKARATAAAAATAPGTVLTGGTPSTSITA
jgi:hypothetical protein